MKPTQKEIQEAIHKTIPDLIMPNLKVLFCGINPGLYSAATGYNFARPGNRFWRTLYLSGFTDHLFLPNEQEKLLEKGYGMTNFVDRATATAAELTNEEIIEGGKRLVEKLKIYKPKWLAVVGISTFRIAFNKPEAKIGRQSEKIHDTNVWVLPNPSGLNAHYSGDKLIDVFKELYDAVENI